MITQEQFLKAEIEVWMDIKGFEGLYQVSNIGRVKSLERKVSGKLGSLRKLPEMLLKPIKKDGYLRVTLQNKDRRNYRIHRLVCEAFKDNKFMKPYVNHINGIKTDNRAENLECCTQKENMVHAKKNNLLKPKRGDESVNSKISEQDAKKIKYEHIGLNQIQIAKIYGIDTTTVSKIKTGVNWKHI